MGILISVGGALGCFLIGYLTIALFIGFPFSIMDQEKRSSKLSLFIGSVVATIIFPPFLYSLGGALEAGNSIIWGCYIEDFFLYGAIIWVLLGFLNTVALVIGIINPRNLGFAQLKQVVLAWLVLNFGGLILLLVISESIKWFSGELSGKGLSCW